MKEERRTKVLTVKLDKNRIGLFNALVDGSGRLGICRTRNNQEGIVDIISPVHTFEDLKEAVRNITRFMGNIEIVEEFEWDGNENFWR